MEILEFCLHLPLSYFPHESTLFHCWLHFCLQKKSNFTKSQSTKSALGKGKNQNTDHRVESPWVQQIQEIPEWQRAHCVETSRVFLLSSCTNSQCCQKIAKTRELNFQNSRAAVRIFFANLRYCCTFVTKSSETWRCHWKSTGAKQSPAKKPFLTERSAGVGCLTCPVVFPLCGLLHTFVLFSPNWYQNLQLVEFCLHWIRSFFSCERQEFHCHQRTKCKSGADLKQGHTLCWTHLNSLRYVLPNRSNIDTDTHTLVSQSLWVIFEWQSYNSTTFFCKPSGSFSSCTAAHAVTLLSPRPFSSSEGAKPAKNSWTLRRTRKMISRRRERTYVFPLQTFVKTLWDPESCNHTWWGTLQHLQAFLLAEQ